ncbi:monooxygenase FAD-binding protein [Mycolicibacterium canariasense]|uniref:Monooxygenase FAD-binding protein n=1 Tax=Mycolicibacterium canariasense TaxID=228230 RepID=A0A124E2X7_MYCCR|nr:FAD-dependent monooxygenase [Mycolicibacterium canariasense]MCV7211701.1 FAD-dependent monooxygenase [Mycolicibacterium canariasense]ORV08216.1 oxidoreductase [Mycolicibacterium canariasense]GAS98225.1 monooxygenase FAD-binding protein [Mycolicibacterium canariasense]
MPTASALISGASIAGPALALWLTEAGWDVTVVERAERLRTSGYPIDIRGTATEIVHRMGLHDQVSARRYRHERMTVLSPRGRRLCTLDYGGLLADSASGDVELTRGALSEVLYRAGADRVDYVFGDTITALTHTDTGVDVTFAHREAQTFDVVIGADGIHSNVRGLTFGDESQFVRHLGPYAAIWDMPPDLFPPGSGFMYSHPGRTVVVERHQDGPARAFLVFVHPNPGSVDRHDERAVVAALRDAYRGDRWRTDEIIATLPDSEDVYFDTVSQVRMPCWSSGRVALVGDAAYAPALLSGQGTSIAIAGAYILAGELVRQPSPQDAFAAYEHRLRGYVERNQSLALRTDSTVISRTGAALLRRNIKLTLVPWLQRFGIAHLLQTQLRSAATDLALAPHDLQRSGTAQRTT